jgi:hypothetical protein
METKRKYKQNISEIEEKIQLLQERLIKHSNQFENNPTNWGFVGDVSYVNEKLEEIVSFFRVN